MATQSLPNIATQATLCRSTSAASLKEYYLLRMDPGDVQLEVLLAVAHSLQQWMAGYSPF